MDTLARRYILDALGMLGSGLPAKAAQYFGGLQADAVYSLNHLAMTRKQVETSIRAESPKLWDRLATLDERAHTGSLGQVHRGTLHDGTFVAIKVQYPNISQRVTNQLSVLVHAAEIAARISLRNMGTKAYLDFFSDRLREETDYIHEARNQERFRWLLAAQNIRIPRIHDSLCTQKVLVQDWIDYVPLEDVQKLGPDQRRLLAHDFFAQFFSAFVEHRQVHGDLHVGNIGLCQSPDPRLVLIDFGSILVVAPEHVQTLVSVMTSLRTNSQFDALGALSALGFNADMLTGFREMLPEVWAILLHPFCGASPFDAQGWHFKNTMAKVLGKNRRTFRMAGPPWFFMLMRTFAGFVKALRILGSPVDTEQIVSRGLENARASVPVSAAQAPHDMINQVTAKLLCVRVVEGGDERVFLQMPARSVEDLDAIVPEDVKLKLQELGYQLETMRDKIERSGRIPQEIFSIALGSKSVCVWLE